jgi:transposase
VLVDDRHSLAQLQVLADAIPQKRPWKRVQAVLLAKQGWTASHISQSLGCSLRAVKNWVAQYNRGGIEALREHPRPGRPRSLAPEHYPRLKQRLDAPPRPEDGVCSLRAADVRRILEREFGVLMGRQAVYDLLHRLGYSDLMPRPHHEDANPEVQEFFKEIVVEQIAAIAAERSSSPAPAAWESCGQESLHAAGVRGSVWLGGVGFRRTPRIITRPFRKRRFVQPEVWPNPGVVAPHRSSDHLRIEDVPGLKVAVVPTSRTELEKVVIDFKLVGQVIEPRLRRIDPVIPPRDGIRIGTQVAYSPANENPFRIAIEINARLTLNPGDHLPEGVTHRRPGTLVGHAITPPPNDKAQRTGHMPGRLARSRRARVAGSAAARG